MLELHLWVILPLSQRAEGADMMAAEILLIWVQVREATFGFLKVGENPAPFNLL